MSGNQNVNQQQLVQQMQKKCDAQCQTALNVLIGQVVSNINEIEELKNMNDNKNTVFNYQDSKGQTNLTIDVTTSMISSWNPDTTKDDEAEKFFKSIGLIDKNDKPVDAKTWRETHFPKGVQTGGANTYNLQGALAVALILKYYDAYACKNFGLNKSGFAVNSGSKGTSSWDTDFKNKYGVLSNGNRSLPRFKKLSTPDETVNVLQVLKYNAASKAIIDPDSLRNQNPFVNMAGGDNSKIDLSDLNIAMRKNSDVGAVYKALWNSLKVRAGRQGMHIAQVDENKMQKLIKDAEDLQKDYLRLFNIYNQIVIGNEIAIRSGEKPITITADNCEQAKTNARNYLQKYADKFNKYDTKIIKAFYRCIGFGV